MSQSPVHDFSEAATLRYKQGWRALNRLLHEDHSFSGHERDCAFLNCGGESPTFATVSAVTGFDFPDDGRGLATADWDFDGDPDIWCTYRTAPRVRLLKNGTAAKPFVAFKLCGDGARTNRDAIGARLELHLRGAAKHPVRIRTLRGGEGFISQSSNWIHFALGDAAGIEKLVVRWPGGRPQEITGIEPGKFYRIIQNKSTTDPFAPPDGRIPLTAATPQIADVIDESARIIVPPGLPLPQLRTLTSDGNEEPWDPKPGRPAVLNLWATWCAPCLAELTEWNAHHDELTAAGLNVIAFNTDKLGDAPGAAPAEVSDRFGKIGSRFSSVRISEAGLRALDYVQRAVLDRWKPLPLPSTFLIDGKGEIVAIYKGAVTAAQLLADLKLAGAGASERRDAAVPFPGGWVDETAGSADPQRVANLMLDHAELDPAIEYLDRCLKVLGTEKGPGRERQLGDLWYFTGVLKQGSEKYKSGAVSALTTGRDLIPGDVRIRKALAQQLVGAGRGEEAVSEMLAAVKISPDDSSLKMDLAGFYERLGRFAEARPLLEELVAANSKNAAIRYRLAGVLHKLGDSRAAIPHYRQTLTDSPRLIAAANDLARILAAHPDNSIRSADEALALAQRLCAITKEKDAGFLDTFAIALANKGNFPQAITAGNKALALIPAENKPAADAVRDRIKLYEAGQPFRFSEPKTSP